MTFFHRLLVLFEMSTKNRESNTSSVVQYSHIDTASYIFSKGIVKKPCHNSCNFWLKITIIWVDISNHFCNTIKNSSIDSRSIEREWRCKAKHKLCPIRGYYWIWETVKTPVKCMWCTVKIRIFKRQQSIWWDLQ